MVFKQNCQLENKINTVLVKIQNKSAFGRKKAKQKVQILRGIVEELEAKIDKIEWLTLFIVQ